MINRWLFRALQCPPAPPPGGDATPFENMMSQDTTTSSDTEQKSLFRRVAEVVERIRPAVQSDGGDVELVEVTADNIARVRLHGACVGCPSATMTLQLGIERNVRERVPEIVAVQQVH